MGTYRIAEKLKDWLLENMVIFNWKEMKWER
jgi:hypothetical protein